MHLFLYRQTPSTFLSDLGKDPNTNHSVNRDTFYGRKRVLEAISRIYSLCPYSSRNEFNFLLSAKEMRFELGKHWEAVNTIM